MARKISAERLRRLQETQGVQVKRSAANKPAEKAPPPPAPAPPPPPAAPVREQALDLGPIVELIATQGQFNRDLATQMTRLVAELELSGSIEATVTHRDKNGDIYKVRFDHVKPTTH